MEPSTIPSALKSGFGLIRAYRDWKAKVRAERELREEELRVAREKRELADSIRHEPPFFYKRDDPNPLCPTCWQKPERNAVYLKPVYFFYSTAHRECPVCKGDFLVNPVSKPEPMPATSMRRSPFDGDPRF